VVDRSAIQAVLLQRQGEASAALLPQWLTGSAFLFPAGRDLAKAKELAAGVAAPLPLGYQGSDPLARAVAERVALNAREAAIVLRPAPQEIARMNAALSLVRVPVGNADAGVALIRLAGALGLNAPPYASTPEQLHLAERALLGEDRIIPLVHLPAVYGLSGRVRNWAPSAGGNLELDDVWLSAPRSDGR
jgi:hypothetical protein